LLKKKRAAGSRGAFWERHRPRSAVGSRGMGWGGTGLKCRHAGATEGGSCPDRVISRPVRERDTR